MRIQAVLGSYQSGLVTGNLEIGEGKIPEEMFAAKAQVFTHRLTCAVLERPRVIASSRVEGVVTSVENLGPIMQAKMLLLWSPCPIATISGDGGGFWEARIGRRVTASGLGSHPAKFQWKDRVPSRVAFQDNEAKVVHWAMLSKLAEISGLDPRTIMKFAWMTSRHKSGLLYIQGHKAVVRQATEPGLLRSLEAAIATADQPRAAWLHESLATRVLYISKCLRAKEVRAKSP